jgi:hypothetical protein
VKKVIIDTNLYVYAAIDYRPMKDMIAEHVLDEDIEIIMPIVPEDLNEFLGGKEIKPKDYISPFQGMLPFLNEDSLRELSLKMFNQLTRENKQSFIQYVRKITDKEK